MGNTDSSPAERQKNRLSKPRLSSCDYKSAPTLALTDVRASIERVWLSPNIAQVDAVNTSTTGERRSSASARQQLWSHLCNYDASEEVYAQDHSIIGFNDTSPMLRDSLRLRPRLSARDSLLATRIDSVAGDSQLSLHLGNEMVDIEATMAALRALSSNATPEELIAVHQALLPLDRIQDELVLRRDAGASSLIRKRSFATPGVATRNTGDLIRGRQISLGSAGKLYGIPAERPPPLREEHENSCLTAQLEKPERKVLTRAQTPADMKCLGQYELGSLFVMNGAPSPAPSAARSKAPSTETASDTGYYTASEGHCSCELFQSPQSVDQKSPLSYTDEVNSFAVNFHQSHHHFVPEKTRNLAEHQLSYETYLRQEEHPIKAGPESPASKYVSQSNHSLTQSLQDLHANKAQTHHNIRPLDYPTDKTFKMNDELDDACANLKSFTPYDDLMSIGLPQFIALEPANNGYPRSRNGKDVSSKANPSTRALRMPLSPKEDSGYSSAGSMSSPTPSSQDMFGTTTLTDNYRLMKRPERSAEKPRKFTDSQPLNATLQTRHGSATFGRESALQKGSLDSRLDVPKQEIVLAAFSGVSGITHSTATQYQATTLLNEQLGHHLIMEQKSQSMARVKADMSGDTAKNFSRHIFVPHEDKQHGHWIRSTFAQPPKQRDSSGFSVDRSRPKGSHSQQSTRELQGFESSDKSNTFLHMPSEASRQSSQHDVRYDLDFSFDDMGTTQDFLKNLGAAPLCSMRTAADSASKPSTRYSTSQTKQAPPENDKQPSDERVRPSTAGEPSSNRSSCFVRRGSGSGQHAYPHKLGRKQYVETARPSTAGEPSSRSLNAFFRRASNAKGASQSHQHPGRSHRADTDKKDAVEQNSLEGSYANSSRESKHQESVGALTSCAEPDIKSRHRKSQSTALAVNMPPLPDFPVVLNEDSRAQRGSSSGTRFGEAQAASTQWSQQRQPQKHGEPGPALRLAPSLPLMQDHTAPARSKRGEEPLLMPARARRASLDEPVQPIVKLSPSTQRMLSYWETQTNQNSAELMSVQHTSETTPVLPKGGERKPRLWSQRKRGVGGALLAKLNLRGTQKTDAIMVPPTIVVSNYITPTRDEFPDHVSNER